MTDLAKSDHRQGQCRLGVNLVDLAMSAIGPLTPQLLQFGAVQRNDGMCHKQTTFIGECDCQFILFVADGV